MWPHIYIKFNMAASYIFLLLATQSHIIAIKRAFYVFDIPDFKYDPYLSATYTIA